MTSGSFTPHRGVLILILGIVGLIVCPIPAPMAYFMGKGDIDRMDRGEMDPEGRGLTQAGMIIGIVASVLWILAIIGSVILFGWMVIVGSAGMEMPESAMPVH